MLQSDLFESQLENLFSCGEKQKLAFARIFIQRPKLVFLDESSSSLSLKSERELYSELKRLDIQACF